MHTARFNRSPYKAGRPWSNLEELAPWRGSCTQDPLQQRLKRTPATRRRQLPASMAKVPLEPRLRRGLTRLLPLPESASAYDPNTRLRAGRLPQLLAEPLAFTPLYLMQLMICRRRLLPKTWTGNHLHKDWCHDTFLQQQVANGLPFYPTSGRKTQRSQHRAPQRLLIPLREVTLTQAPTLHPTYRNHPAT
jgi:hypothetical protein